MTDPRASSLAPLLLSALLACRSSEPAPTGGSVLPTGELAETLDPPSEDRSVEEDLEQLILDSRLESGRRKVELELHNRSKAELAFAFQVEWLDQRGEPVVDRGARWRHLVLPAEASAPLSIEAPSPRAVSWRLRAVRAPR